MNERWEYKVIYIGVERWTKTGLPADINEKIDGYGADGWELVGTEAIISPAWFWEASKTVGIVAFFKRRTKSG